MVEIPATCLAYDEDLSGLIDGELRAERETEVSAHLEGCAHCRERLEALRGVDTALRSVAAPEVSPGLRARLELRLTASAAQLRAQRGAGERRRGFAASCESAKQGQAACCESAKRGQGL